MNTDPIYIRRDHETFDQVRGILGIPEELGEHVTELSFSFGIDQPSVATIEMIVGGDQLQALAETSTTIPRSSPCSPDEPESTETETDEPVWSRGDTARGPHGRHGQMVTLTTDPFVLHGKLVVCVEFKDGATDIYGLDEISVPPPPVVDEPLFVVIGNPTMPIGITHGMSPGTLAGSTHVLRIDTEGYLEWIKGGPS